MMYHYWILEFIKFCVEPTVRCGYESNYNICYMKLNYEWNLISKEKQKNAT